MEKIIEFLNKNFDEFELYEEDSEYKDVSFESNKLKELSSKQSNGEFFFSMNAWKCAVAEKDNYFVQVWIQDNSSPREMNYKELEGHVLKYEKISGKGDRWDTITIIPKGLN